MYYRVPVTLSTISPAAIMRLSPSFISRASFLIVKVAQPSLFVCRERGEENRKTESGVEEDKQFHRCQAILKKYFQIFLEQKKAPKS